MRTRALIMAGLLLTTGCSDTTGDTGDDVTIVATTQILGDIVRTVAGDNAIVEVLMSPGADPHSFQPSVRQVASLRDADLVVANGLGLEEALNDVLSELRGESQLLEVGPIADPLPFESDDHEDEADGHDHDETDGLDPHVWLDPIRGIRIAKAIADELSRLAPTSASNFSSNQAAFATRLEGIDAEIRQGLAGVENRAIVTSHDALGYFAARYDLDVVASIIPGGSTVAEPSARDLADLVDAIVRTNVKAIFTDAGSSSRLAEVLADEVGRPIDVIELYTGTLGPDGSSATTYADMLTYNGARVAEGLT